MTRARNIFNGQLLKIVLNDFTFHIRLNSRHAVIFMCDALSKMVVNVFVVSTACQLCSEGKCKGGDKCKKTPRGKFSVKIWMMKRVNLMRCSSWHDK